MGKKYQIALIAKGEVSGAVKALNTLERRAGKFSGAMRHHMGQAAMVGAAALGVGLAVAAKTGYRELKEAEVQSAKTAAALRSTGRASGMSQHGIESLATELQAMSGVQDDTIQGAENMLLRFTKIGKRGGVFEQATRAALDYSVATGKDMSQASLMLGKALQDPIKGTGALGKAGIKLTDAQKTQVAAWVKSGQTMKAQKLILREVEKRYKGTAKAVGQTTAGQIERAKRAFENMSQTMVTRLAPAAARLAEKAANLAIRIEAWSKTRKAQELFDTLGRTMKTAGQIIERVTRFVIDHHKAVIGVVAVLASLDIGIKAIVVGLKAFALITRIVRVAVLLFNTALIANPIGLVVVGLIALGAAFVLAYKKVEWFRKGVDAVFGFVKRHWRTILVLLAGPIGIAVGLIVRHWSSIRRTVIGGVTAAVGYVRKHWRTILALLTGPIGIAVGLLAKHWGSIKSGASNALGAIKGYITSLASKIGDLPGKALAAGRGMASNIKAGFLGVFKSSAAWIADASKSFANAVIRLLNQAIPNKISIPGKDIPLPANPIPAFAAGGIVRRPTLGIFGEAGPEALIPLGSSLPQRRARQRVMRDAGLTTGGTVINININATQATIDDPHALADRVAYALRTRRIGNRPR